ncbi:MAG: transglutaminase domain-containing protein [Firmicutes bacterium]|nr:transglutaminase domain-containing protein [Bacillota bacterium]
MPKENYRNPAEYYASHSLITDPKEYRHLLADIPSSVSEMVEILQGLFLHIFWAERYGVTPTPQQREHVQARSVRNILEAIDNIDPAPLTEPRPLEKRFFGNCRDHSVLLCAMLRAQGIPARVRCGFATYFIPNHFEDHWICEYWDGQSDRWILVDPQLDTLQKQVLGISFDTLDMPQGQFITGAEAWKLARSGQEDPEKFGIFDMKGLWFIRGNLIRDLASLNKVELLPWDIWGLIEGQERELTEEDYTLLDEVAELIIGHDPKLYEVYQENPALKVPDVITSWTDNGPKPVTLE